MPIESRPSNNKQIKRVFYIATEGITERFYLKELYGGKNSGVKLEIYTKKQGNSSVDKVYKILEQQLEKKEPSKGDEAWLVMDKDHNSNKNLTEHSEKLMNYRKKCQKNDIHFILSDPCFELWLLLHWNISRKPLTANACMDKLVKKIPKFKKSKYKTDELKINVDRAIANAKQLRKEINDIIVDGPPVTNFDELVEKLEQYNK